MNFTIKCPVCKKRFNKNSKKSTAQQSSCNGCICSTTPSPDIMTAYQNIGKTIVDLYGYQDCEDKEKPIN